MKAKIWLILIFYALLPACKSDLQQEITETWPDGQPKKVSYYEVVGETKDKVKEIRYFQNGKKEMEGHYKNGKKEGTWIFWFENGRKQSENTFTNDLRNGKSVVWRDNGNKYYEGTFSMGKLHGTWYLYDIAGTRTKEVHYEHDAKIREVEY